MESAAISVLDLITYLVFPANRCGPYWTLWGRSGPEAVFVGRNDGGVEAARPARDGDSGGAGANFPSMDGRALRLDNG